VQHKKGKNFLIDLVLALNGLEKLNNSLYCERYTVRILLVSNVKSCRATLNFASKEWKIHIVRCYKEGLGAKKKSANKRQKLLKLFA
jgi:hypothetical protein